MVKALDGVYANLRWDIGVSSYPFYWETLNHKDAATATYQLLSNFAAGVAGGGGISRADYIYDNVNLPEVSVAFGNMVQPHWGYNHRFGCRKMCAYSKLWSATSEMSGDHLFTRVMLRLEEMSINGA